MTETKRTRAKRLVIELLLFDERHLRILAADGPGGHSARRQFVLRPAVRDLGVDAAGVKRVADRLLDAPALLERVAALAALVDPD